MVTQWLCQVDGVARRAALPDQLCIAILFSVRSGALGSHFGGEGVLDGWGWIEVPERGFSGRYPWVKAQTLLKWVQFTGLMELRSTVGSPDVC